MILIFKDTAGGYDPDDYDVVAEYDTDTLEWASDRVGLDEFYPSGTPPEAIMQQLDGPTYIAVDDSGDVIDKDRSAGPGSTHANTLADFDVEQEEEEDPDDES